MNNKREWQRNSMASKHCKVLHKLDRKNQFGRSIYECECTHCGTTYEQGSAELYRRKAENRQGCPACTRTFPKPSKDKIRQRDKDPEIHNLGLLFITGKI